MSFYTGTNEELLYASTSNGIARNTFTAEAVLNDTATMGPPAYVPKGFWLPSSGYSLGRAIRIDAWGILSTTASPTFTFTVRMGATQSTSAPIVLGSAATTAGATVTNKLWELHGIVALTAVGTTAGTATVRGYGTVASTGLATPFGADLFAGAASPGTVATVDTTIDNFISVNAACGTSSASNIIQLLQLYVHGLN
jgi:hypothetical protein